MTNYKKFNFLSLVTFIAMICFAFALKGSLPELIPTKFSETGEVLKQAPIIPSIFFLPTIGLLTIWMLTFFVKKNVTFWEKEDNQTAVAQTNFGIMLLIATLYVGTFLNALNYAVFFKYSFFAIGFGLFFLVSAKPMKMMEQNLLYGVRVPWTLTSHTNWRKTHELFSKLMVICGALLIVVGLVTRNHALILSLVGLTMIAPMIYSYRIRNLY